MSERSRPTPLEQPSRASYPRAPDRSNLNPPHPAPRPDEAMSRHVRTAALVMAVATWLSGCDGIFGPDSDEGLEYVVERYEVIQEDEEWSPVPVAHLIADFGIVNTGRDSATVGFDPCAFHLEAFAAGETSRPMWSSQTRMSWPRSNSHFACTGIVPTRRVGPGDTLRAERLEFLRTSHTLAEILADSLPIGSYDFRATIQAGQNPILVDLGSVYLPTSRYPLPDGVNYRDGFRYEVEIEDAAAESAGDAVVKLHVAYSANSLTMALERELVAACPVRLLAFRGPADVTTIPVPEPAWSWPDSCSPGAESVTLTTGESRTFERRIDVEEVAGAAGPGLYHLMGIIEVDGRAIRLSAGEVTVPQ